MLETYIQTILPYVDMAYTLCVIFKLLQLIKLRKHTKKITIVINIYDIARCIYQLQY